MSLEIIIGRNKTGKTTYLEKKYNNSSNKILFIPSEIKLENDIQKGNLGTASKPDYLPHKKIKSKI